MSDNFYTAIGMLESNKAEEHIDALFLDHDLGGDVYVDSADWEFKRIITE